MNYEIVCTNCKHKCNGKLKEIEHKKEKEVDVWKCLNFAPIKVFPRYKDLPY